jgi:hypothetical protein
VKRATKVRVTREESNGREKREFCSYDTAAERFDHPKDTIRECTRGRDGRLTDESEESECSAENHTLLTAPENGSTTQR